MNANKFFSFYKKYGIYIIMVAVIAFFAIFAPDFSSMNNLINILRQVSVLGIAVVAVTFIMISGGMDLSVGGQIAVGGIITAKLMVDVGVPIWLTVILAMAMGCLFGALNGIIAVKLNIAPLIVTLGSMLVLQGLAYVITGGYAIYDLPASYKVIGQGYIGIIPVPVILFIIVIGVAWFILNKTYFGRFIYAMGGNANAALLAGININRMKVMCYALGGFITSIASITMLSRVNSAQPGAASSYPFDCMTATVLGGISVAGGEGTVMGAVMGVIIIGILNNGLLLMGVNSNWQDVVKGIVLVAAVGIDCVQHKQRQKKVVVH